MSVFIRPDKPADPKRPWRSPHYLTRLAPFMDNADWRALDSTQLGWAIEQGQQEKWAYEDAMHELEMEHNAEMARAYRAEQEEHAYNETLHTITDEGEWFYGEHS